MRKYTFFSDPGHGWVRVPFSHLLEFDLVEKISRYSYISTSGKWAYLEEDQDAPIFLHHLQSCGVEYKLSASYCDNSSRIRTYPQFNGWDEDSFPMQKGVDISCLFEKRPQDLFEDKTKEVVQ